MTSFGNLVFVLLALLLTACTAAPPTPASAPEPETVPATPAATPAHSEAPGVAPAVPDRSSMRISIAAVGDMMIGTDYPQDHLPADDGISFLANVAATISTADLAFGNLEGVLIDGGEPGKKCANPAACYLFRSPTRYAEHFSSAGFDALSLANNHARDFGEEGRSSSMEALESVGITHSGREGTTAILQRGDIFVAFVAFAVTRNSNMMLDYELAFETIAAHAEEHDIVVVSFHGGAEGQGVTHVPFADEQYFGEPRGDVVWFARGAVDAGADLVLGHGPHVVRGMERYKDRLIAYSLGNFATYYGISVAGIKGIAAIVTVTLDGNGVFVDGQISSTIQLRPAGPSFDDRQRALNLMRGLSIDDFGNAGLRFLPDGKLLPIERGDVPQHELAPP